MTMYSPPSKYSEPEEALLLPITSADISCLFKKPAGWFARDVVRKRLYRKGFPHPFERGLWSAKAVADWMANAGKNPDGVQPSDRSRRAKRRRRVNAYAPVAEVR